MKWPYHFPPTTVAFHIHMVPTNNSWWSGCLSGACGSHSTWFLGCGMSKTWQNQPQSPSQNQSNNTWNGLTIAFHLLPLTAFHIHMVSTNNAWWSRCLSGACGIVILCGLFADDSQSKVWQTQPQSPHQQWNVSCCAWAWLWQMEKISISRHFLVNKSYRNKPKSKFLRNINNGLVSRDVTRQYRF